MNLSAIDIDRDQQLKSQLRNQKLFNALLGLGLLAVVGRTYAHQQDPQCRLQALAGELGHATALLPTPWRQRLKINPGIGRGLFLPVDA